MEKSLKRIAVTGGAGQIAYSLLFEIANGGLLGPDQPIALHILEVEAMMPQLKGVLMELEDCAFPLLHEVVIGSDPYTVFKQVDYAFFVGAKPRGPGMERKDLLAENGKIFAEQGKALSEVASKNVLSLVVGNPANTNCLIAIKNASKVHPKQFFSMMRLDQNRLVSMLAKKSGVFSYEISDAVIWGNHSSTQVPDFVNAKIQKKSALEVIKDKKWLEEDLAETVQKRGAAVIAARGKSSAASAAHAAIESMRFVIFPSQTVFSIGIYSDGNPYGIQNDLVFSFPCKSLGEGRVEIVKGFEVNKYLKEKMAISEKELIEERSMISQVR